jgi:hypothetical protein
MEVGVLQRLHLAARRALTTAITPTAIGAVEVLNIGQSQGQRAATYAARKHQSVAHTSLLNRTTQTILQILLTYYLTKFHIFFLVCYVLFERSKSTKKTGANRQIRNCVSLLFWVFRDVLIMCYAAGTI